MGLRLKKKKVVKFIYHASLVWSFTSFAEKWHKWKPVKNKLKSQENANSLLFINMDAFIIETELQEDCRWGVGISEAMLFLVVNLLKKF